MCDDCKSGGNVGFLCVSLCYGRGGRRGRAPESVWTLCRREQPSLPIGCPSAFQPVSCSLFHFRFILKFE